MSKLIRSNSTLAGILIQMYTTYHIQEQPRPQGFSLKKWVGREKALASAGHVHSLNIPEKLIYMQPAGFVLTEVERSNDIYRDLYVNIFASVRFKSLRSI